MNNSLDVLKWCLGLLLALAMACGGGGSSSSGGGTSIPVAPAFTIQPTSQTVAVGQTATFTVVATGTPPLSYQWYQSIGNSTSQWNAIPSATSNNYTTPVTILSNSGSNFEVYIENAAGNAFSDMATLTVNAEPVINSFTAYPTMIPRGSPATLSWWCSPEPHRPEHRPGRRYGDRDKQNGLSHDHHHIHAHGSAQQAWKQCPS